MIAPILLAASLACAAGHLHPARLLNVVDGDTVDTAVDLDLGLQVTARIRLYGVDAPEMHDKDPGLRAKAVAAKAYTEKRLGSAGSLVLCTHGYDHFGRILADVYADGSSLGKELLTHKMAVVFMVGGGGE